MKKNTKNFFLLVILLASTLSSSCSKDDDNSDSGSYIGTWKFASSASKYYYEEELYGEDELTIDEDRYDQIVLNEDNTFEYSKISEEFGTSTDEGTYREVDGILYMIYEGDTEEEECSMAYNVSGDVLELTSTEEYYDSGDYKSICVSIWDRQ